MKMQERMFEIQCNSEEDVAAVQAGMREAMKKNIFRVPVAKPSRWFRLKLWLFRKLLARYEEHLKRSSPEGRRWRWVHLFAKDKLIYPGLKLLEYAMRKKEVVKKFEDIPAEWWNNHARMFYWNFDEATKDIWRVMVHRQLAMAKEKWSPEDLLQQGLNGRSYKNRMLFCKLWTTLILEDTADRFWLNAFMIRNCQSMMAFYGVDFKEQAKIPSIGSYPIYTAKTGTDPEFFFKNKDTPVWKPMNHKMADADAMFMASEVIKNLRAENEILLKENEALNTQLLNKEAETHEDPKGKEHPEIEHPTDTDKKRRVR